MAADHLHFGQGGSGLAFLENYYSGIVNLQH